MQVRDGIVSDLFLCVPRAYPKRYPSKHVDSTIPSCPYGAIASQWPDGWIVADASVHPSEGGRETARAEGERSARFR